MPRCDRVKDNNAVYQIMLRGLSESILFRNDEDKDMFMTVFKNIQGIYGFKVYAYLLLSNEAYFIIDANGSDISDFMKRINGSYCQRYNYKYKRYGGIFYDRFRSRILEDESFLFRVTAYVNYAANEAKEYKYSSMGVFVGLIKDEFKFLDMYYIEKHLEIGNMTSEKYSNYLLSLDSEKVKEILQFKDQKSKYISGRVSLIREITTDEIVEFVSSYTGVGGKVLGIPYISKYIETRALSALLMRNFCNFKTAEMLKIFGILSQNALTRLVSLAKKLIDQDERYSTIIGDFLREFRKEAK